MTQPEAFDASVQVSEGDVLDAAQRERQRVAQAVDDARQAVESARAKLVKQQAHLDGAAAALADAQDRLAGALAEVRD